MTQYARDPKNFRIVPLPQELTPTVKPKQPGVRRGSSPERHARLIAVGRAQRKKLLRKLLGPAYTKKPAVSEKAKLRIAARLAERRRKAKIAAGMGLAAAEAPGASSGLTGHHPDPRPPLRKLG